MTRNFDIIIIGAGAVGCAIARELSKYKINVAVLEKEADVAFGTSGRNSAVVHAGFNNRPGSLMAKLCVEGNQGFEQICKDLDVPYKKCGKLIVAFDEEDINTLHHIIEQGQENGCKDLVLLQKKELEKKISGVGGIAAMYSPNTAIFNPFLYTVALAENALANGACFFFNQNIVSITKNDSLFYISTENDCYKTKYLINSAGLFADKIAEMAGTAGYRIFPCRGEYLILDKSSELPIPIYPATKKGIGGLGVHLTPTIDGNIIIGPSAEYINDKEDYATTKRIINKLLSEAKQLYPQIKTSSVIGGYCGIRPKLAPPTEGGFHDFIIQEEPEVAGLINLIGIESPGLTASVPIAVMVKNIITKHSTLTEKEKFIKERKGIVRFRELSLEEQENLIKQNPEYGEVICRCQRITKKEIRDAIDNPLGVKTISSIKYRAWPTTGRCNGGYCLPKISSMLIDEYGLKPEDVCYRSRGSELFIGRVK